MNCSCSSSKEPKCIYYWRQLSIPSYRKISGLEKRKFRYQLLIKQVSDSIQILSPHKNLQHLILPGNLQRRKDLVLWHDVLSNSLSGHRSNNFSPQTVGQLLETLTFFGDHFRAIVYNRRIGNTDIFEKLCNESLFKTFSKEKPCLSANRN